MTLEEIILVGDRVLVEPDEEDGRTEAGLYLPEGVKEKEKIQTGKIVKTGPGYPLPDPHALEVEPWQTPKAQQYYFPLQAERGDHCIFLRNSGIEINYLGKKYVVVPHSSILVLIRRHKPTD